MRVIGTNVGQDHPDDSVCYDSVRHTNLPNMNAVRKLMCVPEQITENRSSHFHRLSQGQGHICGRRRHQHLKVYESAWWFHGCRYSFVS